MANIRMKSLSQLETWNVKELRKLRMTIRNRVSSFENSSQVKLLSKGHPLYDRDKSQCREILEKVLAVEAKL